VHVCVRDHINTKLTTLFRHSLQSDVDLRDDTVEHALFSVYALRMTFVFIYFFSRLIPESCRWLLSKGRKEEALEVLQRVAKSNGHKVTMETLEKLPTPQRNGRVWQLFSTSSTLRLWTSVIFINWFDSFVILYV